MVSKSSCGAYQLGPGVGLVGGLLRNPGSTAHPMQVGDRDCNTIHLDESSVGIYCSPRLVQNDSERTVL